MINHIKLFLNIILE